MWITKQSLMERVARSEDSLRKTRNALVIMFLIGALFIFLWAGERWWW